MKKMFQIHTTRGFIPNNAQMKHGMLRFQKQKSSGNWGNLMKILFTSLTSDCTKCVIRHH
ncbi:hypothetical protein GDO78_010089 [Eleutherodactylus coqui]|uniref:Uncharacterized protein n=1 Tax=Eleutherodactylus coqui TaxID=57060 RepID=A0A8J6F9Y4_ELECQ|nr:hypothetical protein GDO78_010089 [Eleutherodactylus coqui]KAG9484523.1 hypothetical protein GDO78_010089 [Eleutherodactylus coqui]